MDSSYTTLTPKTIAEFHSGFDVQHVSAGMNVDDLAAFENEIGRFEAARHLDQAEKLHRPS